MEPKFIASQVEEQLYKMWEDKGFFEGNPNKNKKPFTIILPPPNANANLHLGHAMYVYEDIMIRYHKLQGFETLWVPGADHAGFETQFVYEKHLKKEGKSRFDFDRETLFKNVWDFVMQNRSNMENQLKRLGFSLDWKKRRFTMDPDVVKIVYNTFKHLHEDGLVYRGKRLVNYCINDGTSFSDIEVEYKEKQGKLWTLRYPLKEDNSIYIEVATTRPETMVGDTAVAVNPKDKRYGKLVGKTVVLPLMNREIPIVADYMVDPKFGTGAVKITPAHDEKDWQLSQRLNLPLIQVIGFDGKMTEEAGPYAGLTISKAREQILTDLKAGGFYVGEKDYTNRVGACYKCGRVIEPLPKEQWFIKVKPLADNAIKLINEGKVNVIPKNYKKVLLNRLETFYDWNISRQIVWGIRIPAYFCKSKGTWFVSTETPKKCHVCDGNDFIQDEDTFDTWFSSGQWPFATLQSLGEDIYNYFYPTSVMETGYDILDRWVARMIMIGYYATKNVPFENVFLHGLVRDKHGQKMSKSKGNVINPLEMVDKYGADALRAALVFGVSEGSDALFAEEKVVGMRNFGNKIWNIGRLMYLSQTESLQQKTENIPSQAQNTAINTEETLKELKKEYKSLEKAYHKSMKAYKFSQGLDLAYQFIWHRFADYYLEKLKDELRNGNIRVLDTLKEVYFSNLVMLHPFIPFVTEAVWQVFHKDTSILQGKS